MKREEIIKILEEFGVAAAAPHIIDELADRLGQLDEIRACPCTYLDEPCKPNCTCKNRFSSAGCDYCCNYGSVEQRTAKAKWLKDKLTKQPVGVSDGFTNNVCPVCSNKLNHWEEQKHHSHTSTDLSHSTPEISNEDEFGPVDLTDVKPDKISKGAKPISEKKIDEMAKKKFPPDRWTEHHRDIWKEGMRAALKELNNE